MKRKYIAVMVTFLLVLAIGIGMYWLLNSPSATPASVNSQDQVNKTEESANQNTEEKEEEEKEEERDSETNNTDTFTDQLTDILSESLQKAVNFFRSHETHVTAIGDSLTQGVGDQYQAGGYVGILDRTINSSDDLEQEIVFDNFGKRGNRTDQLLKRLEQKDIQKSIKQADMVLITIGANDVMHVVKQNITNLTIEPFEDEKQQYQKRLQAIIEQVNDLNNQTDIYLLGFYNPFKQFFAEDIQEFDTILSEWNDTSRLTTKKVDNATFIPVADLFKGADEDLFADDNFHPNYYGYERIADRVLEYTGKER